MAPRQARIIVFGAHPDDCEYKAGGTAAQWAAAGHQVKFVSVTNGDIGHWRDRPAARWPAAARRRPQQARRDPRHRRRGARHPRRRAAADAGEPPHDHELIREWQADIVMAPPAERLPPRPPLHRRPGAGRGLHGHGARSSVPTRRILTKNPVFLYYDDEFQKPNPFKPDVVVAIDEVIDKKLAAFEAWSRSSTRAGANGDGGHGPGRRGREGGAAQEGARRAARGVREQGGRSSGRRSRSATGRRAAKIEYAEGFELCEYGRQPTPEELDKLFPL